MSLTELSKRLNLSLMNLSCIKTGNVKGIRFSTLEGLCEELRCQPGDLFEYMTADKARELGFLKDPPEEK